MRPILPSLLNEASASGISLESVPSLGTVRLQMAGVPKCLQMGVDEAAGSSPREGISLSFPPEVDPTPAGTGALPPPPSRGPGLAAGSPRLLGKHCGPSPPSAPGRPGGRGSSQRQRVAHCVPGPLPAPLSPGATAAWPPPCLGPCTPGGGRGRITEVAAPRARGVGRRDKEPGTHPSARTVAKLPSPRPRGTLAALSGLQGPGLGLWVLEGQAEGPGHPVLRLQPVLETPGHMTGLRWLLLGARARGPGVMADSTARRPLVRWGPRGGWVGDQGPGQALTPALRQSRARFQVAATQIIGKGPAEPSGAAPEAEDTLGSPLRFPPPLPGRYKAGRRLSGAAEPRPSVGVCLYRLPTPLFPGTA